MKSTLKLFAMLMLVTFMASCSEGSDELGTTQPTGEKVYMTFSGSTDATLRTVINSEDNSKIDFEAGDAISVFDVNKANNKFTTTEGGKIAEFGGLATLSDGYTLLYPYQDEATISEGGIVSAVIPAEQVATVGTFDPKANLSIATAADRTNAFKLLNVCSLIRFNVTADYDFVTLTDVNGRAVAGEVKINPADSTATAVAEKASKSVTLKNLKKDNVYYIALLPGAIKLNLKFMTTDGKSFVRTKSTSIDLGRSKVLNIGKITAEESEMTQEWVDLGLPGGTLFATCNVGATTPAGYGGYYAFGDLEEKDYKNYVVGNGSFKENKNLPLEADVAHVVLGGKWRMPTSDELFNIKKTCPRYWTSIYNGTGVYGMIIYKPKGNDVGVNYENKSVNSSNESYSIKDPHIFLPAAGHVFNGSKSEVSLKGNYRSSTYEDNNYAYQLNIASTVLNHGTLSRWFGYSVRPVYDKNL